MIRHLLVGALLIELALVLATTGLAILRKRERRRPGVLLDILPPEGASARACVTDLNASGRGSPSAWRGSISRRRRARAGQPAMSISAVDACTCAPGSVLRTRTLTMRSSRAGAEQRAPSSPSCDHSSSTIQGWPKSRRFHQGCEIA